MQRVALIGLVFVFPAIQSAVGIYAQDQDEEEDDYILEIEMEFGLVEDPDIVARVEAIEQRLIAVVPRAEGDDREIIFKVLDEDNVNAFALPDGHIYLYMGLLDECETDDMLAGVMAHELTHVIHRHHSRMGERQIRGMLIGMAAMVATGEGEGLILGEMLAASMVETYGRSAEVDADRTGATWTVAAGYDPVGYLELMQILEQESIHRPEPGGNYFTIHPHPDERLADIRDSLEELGIEVPDVVYRVHLPLRFYLPLSEAEIDRLEEWQAVLVARAAGPSEEDTDTDDAESTDEVEEEPAIPPSLLSEYELRRGLFDGIAEPAEGFRGVVAIGGEGVFYIAGSSEDELRERGEDIISRLGDKFLGGLRSYEVGSRSVEGVPVLLADRRIIAYTTEADAGLLGDSPEAVNSMRVEALKDLLYRYYVNRRI